MAPSGSATASPRGSTENPTSKERTSTDLAAKDASENAFQKAIAVWRGIDLSSLQKQMDTEASEMITHQRDDLVERKEVAQKTKDFRKLSDADKLSEYKGLLKSYQQFIDHISNHRKSTESLFLNVYNHLSEAPDPYPLLEASVESLVVSEDVTRLQNENNTLRTTNARISAQVQSLERRVEELNREIARKEGQSGDAVGKAEEGFKAIMEEKTANWEAKEKSLQEKVEQQEKLMKELKANYEANLRMGKVAGESASTTAGVSLAELEIVNSDLERATSRLAEMESRNEQLRMQLAQANIAKSSRDDHEELDARIVHLENTNSSLLKKIDKIKVDGEEKIREFERKLKSKERETELMSNENVTLKDKVKACADYEEIKRELEVLKTIEFSTGDDDDDDNDDTDQTSTDGDSTQEKKGKKETLEQLLLARNKKLGSELTVLRVSHQDLTSRLAELQKSLNDTKTELHHSRALNAQLEDDLQKVQAHAQLPSSGMSVAGTYVSRFPAQSQAGSFGPRTTTIRESPTASLLSGKSGNPNQASFDQIRAAAGEAPPSQGILPMITAQRDRFKQRNHELEDELQKTHDTVTSLRQEIASLQKDNLQLYEKSRYVSSYARHGSTSIASSSMAGGMRGVQNNPNTSSGLSLDRYRAAYEANISPFEAFRSRESARAFNRMGMVERVIFSLTRVIMKNRMTRNMFAAYCAVLHLLVFGVLYYSGMGAVEHGLTGHAGDVPIPAADVLKGGVGGGDSAGPWRQEGPPPGVE